MYHYTALVTLLAVLFYFYASTQVARARIKYGVKLPAITGKRTSLFHNVRLWLWAPVFAGATDATSSAGSRFPWR